VKRGAAKKSKCEKLPKDIFMFDYFQNGCTNLSSFFPPVSINSDPTFPHIQPSICAPNLPHGLSFIEGRYFYKYLIKISRGRRKSVRDSKTFSQHLV
jgi:hypothetical protein